MSARLGTSDWGMKWARVGQGGLGGHISIGGGEGGKGGTGIELVLAVHVLAE